MLKYDYADEIKQFLNTIDNNSEIASKAIKNISHTHNTNISILYDAVENLQKENLLLKQILREIIVKENFEFIKENEIFKKILTL